MKKLLLIVPVLALMACGNDSDAKKGTQDAPIGVTDNSAPVIYNMPDGYPNVAFKCAGKNGLYATTRDLSVPLVVIANDPNCVSK